MKKTKRLRRLMRTSAILIAIYLLIKLYLNLHFALFGVYYAKQLPHKEGTDPVLTMFARYHSWYSLPSEITKERDGSTCFTNKRTNERLVLFPEGSANFYANQNSGSFDPFFNTITHHSVPERQAIPKSVHEQFVAELYQFLQPFLEQQNTPLINHQWLFDLVHYDEFNDDSIFDYLRETKLHLYVLGSLGLIFLVVLLWLRGHFSKYALFYAKHTPHRAHCEPTIGLLIQKLDTIALPPEVYLFEVDGFPKLYSLDRSQSLLRNGFLGKERYLAHFVKDELLYVESLENGAKTRIEVTDELRENLTDELYDFLAPILDLQPEPDWNLQWLFDWVYRERFN